MGQYHRAVVGAGITIVRVGCSTTHDATAGVSQTVDILAGGDGSKGLESASKWCVLCWRMHSVRFATPRGDSFDHPKPRRARYSQPVSH